MQEIIKPAKPADQRYEPNTSSIGTGGTYTVRFIAISEGQATLMLIHHRPFEKDVPYLKTCEVTVNVKEQTHFHPEQEGAT